MGESLLMAGAAHAQLLGDAGLVVDTDEGLTMGGVSLREVAAATGTPTFVYSAAVIRRQYGRLASAFADLPHRICYAVKANSTLSVLRILRDLGAGADIVSGGEMERALAAGFDPGAIVFSGVGKTPAELDAACRARIGQINVESLDELRVLAGTAERCGIPVQVGLRVNPNVTTETHPYISTGKTGIKFGVPVDQVADAARLIDASPCLRLTALAMHLGSQLLDARPYAEGVRRLLELASDLQKRGLDTLATLDAGGGLGIRYLNEEPLEPEALASALRPPIAASGLRLHLEPGRYLVGSAGVMLTRVLYRKHSGGKDFVIVDGGMNDLVRPSHYQAYHHIAEVDPRGRPDILVDVVGPVCETGDFLALDRTLPGVEAGELLAFLGAGAYGFVMGSNYNTRPRPAEVMVDEGRWGVARTRETFADLIRGENIHPLTR